MKKLFIILSILFLTACKYDYIVYDLNHPEEYVGIWDCDSVGINNVYHKPTMSNPYFGIYQESFEFMNEKSNRQVEYQSWKIDKTKDPYQFIGMNIPDVPVLTFDVIKTPTKGKMEVKYDSATYYLHKVR